MYAYSEAMANKRDPPRRTAPLRYEGEAVLAPFVDDDGVCTAVGVAEDDGEGVPTVGVVGEVDDGEGDPTVGAVGAADDGDGD